MKYYEVKLVVGVPEEIYKEWDSSCDETFHGPAGNLHDPDNNIWVSDYNRITKNVANHRKYQLFTPEGGI